MTKKNELVWRLKERPTVSEVTELFTQKLIDEEEARSLLFNDSKSRDMDEENKALKEQIEFLQKTVDKLVSNRGWDKFTYTTVNPTVHWHNANSYGWMSVASGNTVKLSGLVAGASGGVGTATTLGSGVINAN